MTLERNVNFGMWLIGAFVGGWIGCQAYYGVSHLWTQRAQLSQVASQAICDRGKARDAAGQLLAADSNSDVSQAVEQGLKGCGKVSPKTVPQVAKILASPK